MRTMTVFLLMTSVLMYWYFANDQPVTRTQKTVAYGGVYQTYRKAVLYYVGNNPAFTGTVTTAALTAASLLPLGFTDLGYTNQILPAAVPPGRQVFVYGPNAVDPTVDVSIASLEWGLSGVGVSKAGRIISPALGIQHLIPFVLADGILISYVEVTP